MLRTLAVGLLVLLGTLAAAGGAAAHPLGNFTVNSYSGIRVEPHAVALDLVVDSAEIPTLQAFPAVNTQAVPQRAQDAYRTRSCADLLRGVVLEVDGATTALTTVGSSLSFPAGAAGLHTMRLACDVRTSAPVETVGTSIGYRDLNAVDRVGWREVTAVGDGVTLRSSDVETRSVSAVLTSYPVDLLASPLDERSASLSITAGTGQVHGAGAAAGSARSGPLPFGADAVTASFTDLVATHRLTPAFGLLAVLLALLLGGLHAFAPGHGKALMAAYLVGRRGSLRQAAVIGLSVTATHTIGVLVLAVVLSAAVVAAPERVYGWLGVLSGLLLVGIGSALLRRGVSQHRGPASRPATVALVQAAPRPVPAGAPARHDHDHHHHPAQDHEHDHDAGHGVEDPALRHSHGLLSHTHVPADAGERPRVRSLLAVGFAGGLVPSPSALVVLLGGIALGRAWFGVLLVLAYGVGMALALTGTGLLLVLARDRASTWLAARDAAAGSGILLGVLRALPALTALVVLVLGLVVMVRGLAAV